MSDLIKELKVVLQQRDIAIETLQKISNPDYFMRMTAALRALEKIEKLQKENQ